MTQGQGKPQEGEAGLPETGARADRRLVLASAMAAALWPTLARAATTAQSVRMHDHNTHTRLVVEFTGALDFKIKRIADPYRLVIEVPGLAWSGPEQAEGAGLISRVQYGRQGTATSNFSVDLKGPVKVAHAFVLPPTGATPTRLVIDVEPATREVFLAGAEPVSSKQVAQSKTKIEPVRKKIVAIDPGHGGIDPGAIGFSGIYEKDITLAAARQLKQRLEGTGRYKAVLTRQDDSSLALRQRTEIARRAPADIFVSLHADSIRDPGVRGLSVYTLSEKASDAEAEALATKENQADTIIGMDLSNETVEVRNILVDLAGRESRNLATHLAGRLIGELQRDVKLLEHTHRFAGFAVLKSPDMPSLLIEMGYLSNRLDESALKSESYRGKLMAAVVRGLDQYFAPTQVARQTT